MVLWLRKNAGRLMTTLGTDWMLGGASREFHAVAWGTGVWWGEFALSWAVIFLGFLLISIGLLVVLTYLIWHGEVNS